ncbi:MAG: NAD(P)/FAD-dependent oxidoreductase [Bradymonadaceae bacterium]
MKDLAHVEVAIIGAGPAGSALAAALATHGRRVALLEKDVFPRDKLCGEFLSPEAAGCLARLGCLDKFLALQPPAMTRVRLTTPNQRSLILSLPGPAYGLSRRELDVLLFEHARSCGARVFQGADVRAIESSPGGRKRVVVRRRGHDEDELNLEADVVVAAYGRRSRLDRRLHREFFDKRSPYIAFKQHHRACNERLTPPLRDVVELHSFDGGYCGVSYVEDDIVNVCTMIKESLLHSMTGTHWEDVRALLATRHTALARRLATLEPCQDRDMIAVAQIPLALKDSTRNGLLFVGDAAGMIAPLAGDGQAMALESALTLADLLHTHLPDIPHRQWKRHWRRHYEPRVRLGRHLQRAMIQPQIARTAMHILTTWPSLGQTLIGLTRG